jgi:hypothetical protein
MRLLAEITVAANENNASGDVDDADDDDDDDDDDGTEIIDGVCTANGTSDA